MEASRVPAASAEPALNDLAGTRIIFVQAGSQRGTKPTARLFAAKVHATSST